MSASTEAAGFEPLPLNLEREHLDTIEGLLTRRRGLRFDGEHGLAAWSTVARGLSDRLAASSVSRREETLRQARIRLRSPVPGEATAGAFVVASLSDDGLAGAGPLVGSRRSAAPVLAGLRAAAASRIEPGAIDNWMDVDVWSAAGLISSEVAAARMKSGDVRGACIAWARGTAVNDVGPDLEHAASAGGSDAPLATYALGRHLGERFAPWLRAHQDVAQDERGVIAVAVFGDESCGHLIELRGHAGIRALGWLGVPRALASFIPLLEEGSPDTLLRGVVTALFISSGLWFVRGGLPALRSTERPAGDPDAARAWLRGLGAERASVRHHLGIPVADPWPERDEPMSRRWLRSQLGLTDSPTARELPDPLLSEAMPPRLAPTDLSFVPGPPWAPVT